MINMLLILELLKEIIAQIFLLIDFVNFSHILEVNII